MNRGEAVPTDSPVASPSVTPPPSAGLVPEQSLVAETSSVPLQSVSSETPRTFSQPTSPQLSTPGMNTTPDLPSSPIKRQGTLNEIPASTFESAAATAATVVVPSDVPQMNAHMSFDGIPMEGCHPGRAWKFMYRRVLGNMFKYSHFYHPKWLPRGSTLAATFNMATATIGVGTLSIPMALHEAGVWPFMLIMVALFILTIYSLKLLTRVAAIHKLYSFELLSRKAFGHKVEVLTEVFVIIGQFGSGIAYIVVIGDVASSVVCAINTSLCGTAYRILFQTLTFLCVMFPLSLLRTLDSLKFASFVGVAAMGLLIAGIVLNGMRNGAGSKVAPMTNTVLNTLNSLSVLFFAVGNQINAVEIFGELHESNTHRFMQISVISVGGVMLAYLAVGFAGLAAFGPGTNGNILKNFTPGSDILITAAFAGIAIKTVLTFPMIMFPCREALFHMLGVADVHAVPTKRWAITTTLIVVGAWGLAVVVPSVMTLFGLIGSVTGALFMFVLPALYALRCPEYWSDLPVREAHVDKAFIWVMLAVGVIGGFVLTILNIFQLVAG